MIRFAIVALTAALFGTAPVGAEMISARSFDKPFNSASKRLKTSISLQAAGCSALECEFGAVPDLRLLARGEGGHGSVEEISAYLPRDSNDRERSTRSVLTATKVITTLMAVFNPGVAAKERGKVVMALMEGATSSSRRGEVNLGGVRYVLSATQGDNLRVYVTR